MTVEARPIRATLEEEGSLLRVVLARPKGNVLDVAMLTALRNAVAARAGVATLRAILFEGEGAHFSFGASVEEHCESEVERMLPLFHATFRDLAASRKVLLSAVRGMCLGGGLELAAFCHRCFASGDAKLGSPEIQLGVFAPIASVVLPRRIGQARADDLLLTGRIVEAPEALSMGLVDEIAGDPARAALEWHRRHLLPRSAAALAHAVGAARLHLHDDLDVALTRLERRYLDELMSTADAREGIAAFVQKRPPRWQHR